MFLFNIVRCFKDIKPPLSLPTRNTSNSQVYPQNLRPGLNEHMTGNNLSITRGPASPSKRMADHSGYSNPSSRRTIQDLITSEIEKSLSSNGPTSQSGFHSQSPFGGLPGKIPAPSHSPGSQSSTMSRVSQVIEDSLRGGKKTSNSTKELEGLACPRTRSPTSR